MAELIETIHQPVRLRIMAALASLEPTIEVDFSYLRDLLQVGAMVLAGCGFRTDRRAHGEISAALGTPVISLELVDPRFYHLDTAMAVLDDHTIAYYPPAFSEADQRHLHTLFPNAIVVGSADAYALGLNVVSDGLHVVLPAAETGFAAGS